MSNFYYQKKILVTGSAGFVGFNLVNRLVGLGAKVRATFFHNPPPAIHPSVEYMRVDLRNLEDCNRATCGFDYVFMAAANSSGAEIIQKTPLVHLTPNLLMNAQMLESAHGNGIKKFCFISSNVVYPLTDFPVKEDDVNNEFFDKYYIVGWMKRFTELMCEMYSKKVSTPMETIIIRPANLYGPYDKFTVKNSKVIPALIRRAIEREEPYKIWGDGTEVKDFLYIDDFIDGMLRAFEKFNQFEIVNIASGSSVSVRDILQLILAKTKYTEAEIIYDLTMPTMIPKRLINIDKAKNKLLWSPKTSLSEGIAMTVDWYNSYYESCSPEEKNDY